MSRAWRQSRPDGRRDACRPQHDRSARILCRPARPRRSRLFRHYVAPVARARQRYRRFTASLFRGNARSPATIGRGGRQQAVGEDRAAAWPVHLSGHSAGDHAAGDHKADVGVAVKRRWRTEISPLDFADGLTCGTSGPMSAGEPSEYQALIAVLVAAVRPIPRVSRDFPMARSAIFRWLAQRALSQRALSQRALSQRALSQRVLSLAGVDRPAGRQSRHRVFLFNGIGKRSRVFLLSHFLTESRYPLFRKML